MSATEFWTAFSAKAKPLRTHIAARQMRVPFGEIEHLLAMYGYGFAFELTEEGGDAVLVLTPEGDKAAASRIDELLSSRPTIQGWRFYGRRQRKPLPDALKFVQSIYDVDLRGARFSVRAAGDGRRDVIMHAVLPSHFEPEHAQGLLTTFLDHAIGEENVMALVGNARVDATIVDRGRLLSPEDLVASFTA